MKKFVIIGSGGSCDDQYGVECENEQVLGIIQADTADEAFDKLIVPGEWIFQNGASYTDIWALELKDEEAAYLQDIMCGWPMFENEYVMNMRSELDCIYSEDEKIRIEVYVKKLKDLMEKLKDGWSEDSLPKITVNTERLNPLEIFWFVQDFSKAVVSTEYTPDKIFLSGAEEGFRKMLNEAKSHADALAAIVP